MKLSYILEKSIQPQGYLQEKMKADLEYGFVGHLPTLAPSIMKEDDIYGEHRRGLKLKEMKLGVAESEVEGSLQLQWWNSESQSNWLDGFIRHAFYVGGTEEQQRAKQYVDTLLETQDSDGYLGIYQKDTRYTHSFESGELWAQTTLFRALLGYYHFTKEMRVLNAVKRAVDVTMKSYPMYQSNPFLHEQSHGLVFVDVLLELYRYTKNEVYIEYGSWLYLDFSQSDVAEYDVQERYLKSNQRFSCHGVHTYEHVRGLLMYDKHEQTAQSAYLLMRYLEKFQDVQTPSGGVIGDEWITEKIADSEMTGYEYCSLHEAFHSLMELSISSGDKRYADQAEWLFWNAAQGARHPKRSAIAYLKSDDSYEMMGDFHRCVESVHKVQIRYKYSAVHQDAAICCVPMAGRISPYYFDYSLLRSGEVFIQMLYADMEINIAEEDLDLNIHISGNYPFQTCCQISIDSTKAITYMLRIPSWAKGVYIDGKKVPMSAYVKFDVLPEKQTFKIEFKKELELKQTHQNTYYATYGPLLYALPLNYKEQLKDTYKHKCFEDAYYEKVDEQYEKVKLKTVEVQEQQVFAHLELALKEEKRQLYPLCDTILRKVTFEMEPK